METRQLFDRPMDEFREAFVRGRFTEQAVFGEPEIEGWLLFQRKAERPYELGWPQYLARDFLAMCVGTDPVRILQACATTMPATTTVKAGEHGYGSIYFRLRDGLYEGTRGPRAQIQAGSNEMFTLEEEGSKLTVWRIGDLNRHIGAKAVVDVLFMEWDRQRPKWKEAREFLCDALGEEIKRAREKAEHDFDTAVAVSADGTKIVHADWVVVWNPTEMRSDRDASIPSSVSIHPAKAFAKDKVRRNEDFQRWHDTFDPHRRGWENAAEGTTGDPIRIGHVLRELWVAWRRDRHMQSLLELEICGEQRTVRVFTTPDTECPSSLSGDPLFVSV